LGGPNVPGPRPDDGFLSIPRLIEDQAGRHPDRAAVSFAGRTLSYRQLDELASGLAADLAARGVTRADRVAVLLVNSLELPVAYFALMKLGAVFVPMDPAWPADRLRTALTVLEPRAVLRAAEPPVPGGDPVPEAFRNRAVAVAVDDLAAAPHLPAVPLGPGDLIYGIFTSGTTGIPKCALNRQAGLANRFAFLTRWFPATGDEIVLQNSGHTYDSSLWQLLWPLTTGGRAVLPAQGEFLNLQHTIDVIGHYGVTTTDFVSSIFNALVSVVDGDELAQRKLASLRHVIVGGEEINPRAVHRMRELLPQLEVTNGYGPTETSIGMIFHRVAAADGDTIPLGYPIDNCAAVIVDDQLRPAGPGEVGEIAIGGVCVGAGYHGNQAATDAAFIPNPFPGWVAGDRMYLSGDLGYTDDRGRFFFCGRKDFQVKIGGVRIELGEIEAAAQSCPGVQQAIALVAEQDGNRSLALMASGGGPLTETALRDHLRGRLPRTSLPRYYTVLPVMPLTDGGKADRRALQTLLDDRLAADAAGLGAGVAGVAGLGATATGPADPGAAELSVAELTLRAYRLALGQPALTADAHFLDAGGDSLQALSAVRALTSGHGFDVCVQDLLDYPTAAQLALLIESRQQDRAPDEAEAALMDQDSAVPGLPAIGPADPVRELGTVIVSGPTGFVGTQLVHQLLAGTSLRVLCLVRAPDDTQATTRVIGSLAQRGLWEPRFASRLTGYAAQLGQPGLGLSPRTWDQLAREGDLVLHNGALVNLVFGYRAHRLVNVRGTSELLRLALDSRPVPLHHISTLAAFQPEARQRLRRSGQPMPESVDPAGAALPGTGYARSKWVAERQLAEARRRGATVTILRLGEVMPAEDGPQPNPAALTHLLLSAISRLGVAPDAAIVSDYSPADYVAARVVAAVLDRRAWGQDLHVFRPGSVPFDDLLRQAGAPVRRVPCLEFLTRLDQAAGASGDRELAMLAALLPGPSGADEGTLRRELGDLLTDNPALFRRDGCRALEQRWDLPDGRLDRAIQAYRDHLSDDQQMTATG
jgi:amino acid adenylation domain-containing protein/thioester reductase-like protein